LTTQQKVGVLKEQLFKSKLGKSNTTISGSLGDVCNEVIVWAVVGHPDFFARNEDTYKQPWAGNSSYLLLSTQTILGHFE
jgi:hypothetical protein